MPKHITVTIQVEEIALGYVMRVLHNTPGVIKFDFDMGDPKPSKRHSNGKGVPKPRYKITGDDLMMKLLYKAKAPMRSSALSEAFEKDGRSPSSIASILHYLKGEGLIVSGHEGYVLTKKAKDRMRHRKEA